MQPVLKSNLQNISSWIWKSIGVDRLVELGNCVIPNLLILGNKMDLLISGDQLSSKATDCNKGVRGSL